MLVGVLDSENRDLRRQRRGDEATIRELTQENDNLTTQLVGAIVDLHEVTELIYDDATSLPTKRIYTAISNKFEEENTYSSIISHGGSLQLTLVDLNKLGQHNNLGGLPAGDLALKTVSERIVSTFRRSAAYRSENDLDIEVPTPKHYVEFVNRAILLNKYHDMVFRIGGDEFLVISYVPYSEDAQTQAETIQTEALRVYDGLDGATVMYGALLGGKYEISSSKLGDDGLNILDGVQRDENGKPYAIPVTSTYAVTRLSHPSKESVIAAIEKLNLSIEKQKRQRQAGEPVATLGEAVVI